jgi:hypothetical protein
MWPRNYDDKGDGFQQDKSGESWGASPDVIPSILTLTIAVKVLAKGGRNFFFFL